MQGLNVIWVFNKNASKVLMCKRQKEPFKGLYNLVGGKIEPGEDKLTAAYRELQEETGITDIKLHHLMSCTYYMKNSCRIEIYAGKLPQDVIMCGDENELAWIDINEDFFDMSRFAGDGNLGHVYEVIKQNACTILVQNQVDL